VNVSDDPPSALLALTGSSVTEFVVALLLLTVAGFLAAAEMTITRASRARTEELAHDGDKGALRLLRRLDDLPATRTSLSLAGIVAVVVAAFGVAYGTDEIRLVWKAVVVILFVLVAFTLHRVAIGLIGSRGAERGAITVCTLVNPVIVVFRPVAWAIGRAVGAAFRSRRDDDAPASEEELRELIDRAGGDVIEREEARLLNSVFEFGDTVVREVMVPRPDMFCLSCTDTVGTALTSAAERGFSRIPVYGDGLDDIAGLLYVKDLLQHDGDRAQTVGGLVRDAHFVPEQKRSTELLGEMQRDKFHMAIVVDEYGGTAGLVTMEDLLEELVGEIADEYDSDTELVEYGPDGHLRVAGRLPLADLAHVVGFECEVSDADTVGGAMLVLLGRIPRVGEEVQAVDGRLLLRALRVEGHRVELVEVVPAGEPAAGEAAASEAG